MKNIKIIDKIDISINGLVSTCKRWKKENVFLRQGDADGACGLYCTFMALIMCGIVKRNEIIGIKSGNDDRFREFLSAFDNFSPLIKECTTARQLSSSVKNNFGEDITFRTTQTVGIELLEKLKKELLNDNPMIIGVNWPKGGGHWVLAVGIEYRILKNNEIAVDKIFLLDSLDEEPISSYWNKVILVDKNQEKYRWLSRENNENGFIDIELDYGIIIRKKD